MTPPPEIEEFNLTYLLLAQKMLLADRISAMFRLKVNDEMADLMTQLNVTQLTQMARTNQLLCHFAFHSADQLRPLVDNPRDQGLSSFHAALLLASPRGMANAQTR